MKNKLKPRDESTIKKKLNQVALSSTVLTSFQCKAASVKKSYNIGYYYIRSAGIAPVIHFMTAKKEISL